jgi:hypothetical protein
MSFSIYVKVPSAIRNSPVDTSKKEMPALSFSK